MLNQATMLNQRYAVIATAAGADQRGVEHAVGDVVNVVVWDGQGDFDPGSDLRVEAIRPGWDVVDRKLAMVSA